MVAGAVVLLVAAVSVFFVAPAGAQTTCQASPTYNPSATIGANPVTVTQGTSVTITGTGFAPNCSVTVSAMGQTVTVTTNAAGGFTAVFSTTGVAPGSYIATAVQSNLSLSTNFNVVAAAVTPVTTVAPVAPVAPVVTGTLPTTGSNSTTTMVTASLGLLAIGGLLVLFARKRHGADALR